MIILLVCLYKKKAKTAKPIGPKCCVWPHMTPAKVYGCLVLQKVHPKAFYLWEILKTRLLGRFAPIFYFNFCEHLLFVHHKITTKKFADLTIFFREIFKNFADKFLYFWAYLNLTWGQWGIQKFWPDWFSKVYITTCEY